MILGFRLSICYRLVVVWWMTNKRNFCFIIELHNLATLENRLTYRCPSSWAVVITMKKKLPVLEKYIGYWPVQINGKKFATSQILGKPVEVVKGRILAGWAQKSPGPCLPPMWALAPGHACPATPCHARSQVGLAARGESRPLMGLGHIHVPEWACAWAHGAPHWHS